MTQIQNMLQGVGFCSTLIEQEVLTLALTLHGG